MQTFRLRCSAAILFLIFASSTHAATYAVNSTADPGDSVCDASCTLRDAIIAANTGLGQDTIDFSGVTGAVPVTIMLLSGLPLITDSVIMDASIAETRVLPGNPSRRPGVELDLSAAEPQIHKAPPGHRGNPFLEFFPDGLNLSGPGASGSVIRGFIINGLQGLINHGLCNMPLFNPSTTDPSVPEQGFCGHAIAIFGANDVHIAGNYLNLDAEGLALNGNGVTGVALTDGSDNMIGGYSANDRNVMTAASCAFTCENAFDNMIQAWLLGWSGPAFGAPKEFNHNRIIDNYLGVNAAGDALNPEVRGIWLMSINIEDFLFGSRLGWGVQCDDQLLDPCEMIGNVIEGNTITNISGRASLALFGLQEDTVVNGNTTFNTAGELGGPVEIGSLKGFPGLSHPEPGIPLNMLMSDNVLGLDTNGTPFGNVIFGIGVSGGDGIRIENNIVTGALLDGISVGDDPNFGGEPPVNVTISRNSISNNCLLADPICAGINLTPPTGFDGVTPNDPLDLDEGGNHLQNFPVLLEIVPGKGKRADTLKAELDSSPSNVYLVEFFSNSGIDASGRVEGERFLGQTTVVTDDDGHVAFDFEYNEQSDGALATDGGITFITATATRKHCEPVSHHVCSGAHLSSVRRVSGIQVLNPP